MDTYRVTFTEGYLDVLAKGREDAIRVCCDELQTVVKVKSVKRIAKATPPNT